MEIEKDCPSENLRETIIINSDNYPILNDINLKTQQHLRVYVDIKNNTIRQQNQLYFANVMQALNKAEIIEMNIGMRFERKKESKIEDQGDWIHFIKGIGQSKKILVISIGEYLLNNSNLAQFEQELLRLNFLEKFHLQIGKAKNFGLAGFTQLGEALRRMIQLQDLSIMIGDDCSLGVNGAKNIFYGIEACEKIRKLRAHIGSNNGLKSEGIQVISAAVGQLQQVNDFDLFIDQTNDIGNEGIQYITNNILQKYLSKSTEKLSLVIDEIKATKEEIIVQMFTSIEGFTKLKELSLQLGVKKVINMYSIKAIEDSLKKLTSLLRISISINSDTCALCVTPMVDLLTRFELSDNLVNLQLVMPPQNEFNNSALSLFAANLKRLQQLQVFSLEIQKNNLRGNTTLKRKLPTNQETTQEQESIPQPRGISDISETLSCLKKLEKVEWIISAQNDVSDGGWEILSRSQSLREFKVKIGEYCRLQDEGLISLSKISSSISLNCLRIEVLDQNETSQGGWSNLFNRVNFEKMKDFKISVGKHNECREKSVKCIAEAFERTSPHIEYLTLDFKDSQCISSQTIQELANSIKSMIFLKQLAFIMPEDSEICRSTLKSLSNSLEKMRDLIDLKIFLLRLNHGELLDEIQLCSTICSLRKLSDLNLQIAGNRSLIGSSIISKAKSKFPTYSNENQVLFEFRTESGLQFQGQVTEEYVSQEEIHKLADYLAETVLTQQIVYFQIFINPMKQADNCLKFTPIISVLSGFKKCIKLNIYYHSFPEIQLNQLAVSITCMPFLSDLTLRFESSVFSLKAAETLAAFFENSPRITKVQLMCKSNPDIDQSQAQFLLMSSILTCPNLTRFEVLFESCQQIGFQFNNQPKIEDLSLVSETQVEGEKIKEIIADEMNKLVKKTIERQPPFESIFQFITEDYRKSITNENLIFLAQFLVSTQFLKTIKLQISSEQYISTEITSKIIQGIINQANLTDLYLEFSGQCFVSGSAVFSLLLDLVNYKNNIKKTIKIQTDDTLSEPNFFRSFLINSFKSQKLQKKRDDLKIARTQYFLTFNDFYSNKNTISKTTQSTYIALYNGSEYIHLSQIADNLLKQRGVQKLFIDASEIIINQDWSSLQQLSFLTLVSIQDKSPMKSSRFLSLESSLSHMTHLKSLTLNLSHIHENLCSQETIIVPFGKCLNNLKEITQFTITLKDFNFGEDGGQALGYGIEGLSDLEKLEIEFINPQNLPTEGIKYLCEVISKSSKIQQFNFCFQEIHSSLEIPYFILLKNQLLNKQQSLKRSSIQVYGEINQAFGSFRQFSNSTISNVDLNSNSGMLYEFQLPSKYCLKSAFENEAVNKCADILQVYYSFDNEISSIGNLMVVFDFTKPEYIEPNLIFLKTLFSVLKQEQRRVKLLKIMITLNQNGQFQFINDSALKDIKLVDTFHIYLETSCSYSVSIKEFISLAFLEALTNIIIFISFSDKEFIKFRQTILRKMKRLCQYELFYYSSCPFYARKIQ